MKCYKCKVDMQMVNNWDRDILYVCPECKETEWKIEAKPSM
jgi:hypothetical protein